MNWVELYFKLKIIGLGCGFGLFVLFCICLIISYLRDRK